MIKRIIIIATLALTALATIAPAAQACHRHHVRPKVCARQWLDSQSATAAQCRRQGWLISVSYAPIGDALVRDVLVIGPAGKVYVDTFGQIEFR